MTVQVIFIVNYIVEDIDENNQVLRCNLNKDEDIDLDLLCSKKKLLHIGLSKDKYKIQINMYKELLLFMIFNCMQSLIIIDIYILILELWIINIMLNLGNIICSGKLDIQKIRTIGKNYIFFKTLTLILWENFYNSYKSFYHHA